MNSEVAAWQKRAEKAEARVAELEGGGHAPDCAGQNAEECACGFKQRSLLAENEALRAEVSNLRALLAETDRQRVDVEAERDRLRDALNKAGEWVAAVEPKLPMPGTGDSQQEVLDMIAAALAAQGSEEDKR